MSTQEASLLVHRRKDFWDHQEPSVEAMIQAVTAEGLADDDADEVMNALPRLTGKRVIDLGAGIGRFTERLARTAQQVTAVDVSQTFIEENRVRHQHHPNVTCICDDVVNMSLPPGSVDLVFSNWLLKYLSEAEIAQLLSHALSWLAPGGHIFFRESCFVSLASVDLKGNPTIYRHPERYGELLRQVRGADQSSFKLIRVKNILAYINYENAANQVCFLAQRVEEQDLEGVKRPLPCPYDPLAADTPTKSGAARAAGGAAGLTAGQRVLEVGCGTGEAALFLALHYGVHVHGVDLYPAKIFSAIRRQVESDHQLRRKLHFEMSTSLELDCDSDTYDLVLSRQTLHKVQDKKKLFADIYRCVKPGGKVVISDYCRGASQQSDMNLHHGHELLTVEGAAMLVREAGFKGVASEDLSQELIRVLQADLNDPKAADSHKMAQEQVDYNYFTALIFLAFIPYTDLDFAVEALRCV